MADVDRYNLAQLPASAFAPVGAHVRVSLLAPLALGGGGGAEAAPESVTTKVPLRLESGPEGALVALDVRTRQVLALVGNYEAVSGGLDRATQAHRQPGSTFKPIVYSYAIHSRRFTPATLVDVTPTTFAGGYHPANYEGWKSTDPLRLREALANSVNVVAVRVLDDVGPANVVEWAQSLGIRSTMKPDLSLALGSYEVEPIELAGAYATFAAGGEYEEPRVISRIVGPDGRELALPPLPPPRRVLDEAESYVVTNMLQSVIDHGTGQRAKALGRPVAGKTGTSNLSKDTWFAGFTTGIAAVVWVGYDDGKPLGASEQGAVTALPAWVSFMKVASEHKPPSEFPRPPGVITVEIDAKSGKLPYAGDTDTLNEVFLAGTEPTEVANPYPIRRAPPPITAQGADRPGPGPSPRTAPSEGRRRSRAGCSPSCSRRRTRGRPRRWRRSRRAGRRRSRARGCLRCRASSSVRRSRATCRRRAATEPRGAAGAGRGGALGGAARAHPQSATLAQARAIAAKGSAPRLCAAGYREGGPPRDVRRLRGRIERVGPRAKPGAGAERARIRGGADRRRGPRVPGLDSPGARQRAPREA